MKILVLHPWLEGTGERGEKMEDKWTPIGSSSQFKVKRNYVIHLMNEARCPYYRQFIDKNSSDQSKLFRASKSLLNLLADKILPTHQYQRLCSRN